MEKTKKFPNTKKFTLPTVHRKNIKNIEPGQRADFCKSSIPQLPWLLRQVSPRIRNCTSEPSRTHTLETCCFRLITIFKLARLSFGESYFCFNNRLLLSGKLSTTNSAIEPENYTSELPWPHTIETQKSSLWNIEYTCISNRIYFTSLISLHSLSQKKN